MKLVSLLALVCASALASLLPGCQSTTACSPTQGGFAKIVRADLEMPIAQAPYTDVKANWKERIEQTYVYRELRGSYTETARALKDVMEAAQHAGLQPTGAPFALFYDDPGTTPIESLRSRACVPVEGDGQLEAPYDVDLLPSETVVYAFVGGPYGDVPRAYPGVFGYVAHMGWKECGPIREIYLVPPGSVSSWNELVCEVQVPSQPAH